MGPKTSLIENIPVFRYSPCTMKHFSFILLSMLPPFGAFVRAESVFVQLQLGGCRKLRA